MKKERKFDEKKIERKLKLASDLFEFAFKAKSFRLKQQYPELSEEKIRKKTYELIKKGCS